MFRRLVCTGLLVVASGCATGAAESATGERRIITMSAGITETVYALGLGDEVVGRDLSSTLAAAADLPVVTAGHDVSAESVLALRPTIIMVDEDTGPKEALEQIAAAGVRVETVEKATSVDEIVPRLNEIASILEVPDRGAALAAQIENDLQSLAWPDNNPPTVAFLYLRGTASVYLIGGPDCGPDSLIVAAGARDGGTAIGLTQPFTTLTPEALVKAQPDILWVTTTGLESVEGVGGLLSLAGVKQTPAGANGRIITVEDGLLFSFGPRTPQLIASLHEQMVSMMGAANG
jgi:iron complex transport system substrate-binding protein